MSETTKTNQQLEVEVAALRLRCEAAEQEREFLGRIYDQLPISTQVFSPEGWTLLVNQAWKDLFGSTEESVSDFNILQDAQLMAAGAMPLIETAFTGKPVVLPTIPFDASLSIEVPENGTCWIRAEFYPVKSRASELQYVICQHHDVSELKELEADWRSRNEEMAAVAEVQRARVEAELVHVRNVELQCEIEERQRLHRELEKLAVTDQLTGLYNRRHFFNQIENESYRAQRYLRPLCVALLDIDCFKQVNDTYGHGIGDRTLQQVAEILRSSIRVCDFCARYGGEEFVVLLPEIRPDQALEVMERIRLKIAEEVIPSAGGKFSVTVSIGIAGTTEQGAVDFTTLIEEADHALYAAKAAGRNCSVVYHDDL